MAKPIWVIGSGGVSNAAAANIIITTYFLRSFRNWESTTPTLASKLKTTGSWKLKPKAKINFIINDKYSFTFASNWIGKFVLRPVDSKDKKIDQPIAIKLSPDIDDGDVSRIVELIKRYSIQGIIISNTTDSNRDNLSDVKKNEVGGLSGQPLKDISTNLIKKFYKDTKGKIKIIGVGGVDSGQSAFEKIAAGADAVQLYTGMIYKGPGIVKDIKKELISILKKENFENISQAIGINAWPTNLQELYSSRKIYV